MDSALTSPRVAPAIKIAPRADWLLACLLFGPLLIALGKLPMLPTAHVFSELFCVDHLPPHSRHLVTGIFFVPIGALIVVAFRRILGLKVLGFFRPILVAVAFESAGVLLGTLCLVTFLAAIAAVRPLLKGAPYNTRIPILLSLVSAMLSMLLAAGGWWDLEWLQRAAYFPVIALCLTCEAFAKVLENEGPAEATWRTVNTIASAGVIAAIAGLPVFMTFMLKMPELLFLEAGAILLLARHLSFRVFEDWNPLRAGARRPSVAGDPLDSNAMDD